MKEKNKPYFAHYAYHFFTLLFALQNLFFLSAAILKTLGVLKPVFPFAHFLDECFFIILNFNKIDKSKVSLYYFINDLKEVKIIKNSLLRQIRMLFAILLLWIAMVMLLVVAGELIITCIAGIIALILFVGGLLLSFSIKPRGYGNATWMSGIAFFILLDSIESIKTLGISFLNATSFLTWTAVAFILLAMYEEGNTSKRYMYATIAFTYVAIRVVSH